MKLLECFIGMENMDKEKSKDFNIYYLNFSKVYEIAMMINNVILTKIERDNSYEYSEEVGFTSSFSAQGTKQFLEGIKASISADAKETSYSSLKVVESLDVKTTKSILLRRVIDKCFVISDFSTATEGDLIKIDNVKLNLVDEESLRQFLILRRDALKGMRVDGLEINNLIASMLQDYAYLLKGVISVNNDNNCTPETLIKIPMDVKSEFESQYSIDDLLIGHVSIIGIYKGVINKSFVSSSTFSYLREAGSKQKVNSAETAKIIKSNSPMEDNSIREETSDSQYHFIDILAIIQDVAFDYKKPVERKIHWWNRLGLWLSKLGRKTRQ